MTGFGGALAVSSLLITPAAAADHATEVVPVYTNADLARFGEPSAPTPPVSGEDVDRQWEFVHDHLEREYARIEALREIEAERAAALPLVTRAAPDPWSGHLLLAPWSLFGCSPVRSPRQVVPPWDTRLARHGFLVPRAASLPVFHKPPVTHPRRRPHPGRPGDDGSPVHGR